MSRLFHPSAYSWNLYSLLPLLSTLVLWALLVFIGVKPGDRQLRRGFAAFTAVVSLWTGGLAALMSLTDERVAIGLARFLIALLGFEGPIALHFSCLLVRRPVGRWWPVLLSYSAATAVFTLFTSKVLIGVWRPPWGGFYAYTGPWFLALAVPAMADLTVAAGLGLSAARRAHGLRRRQLVYVSASQLIGIFAAYDMLALYRIPRFPMIWLTSIVSMGLVFYSIAEHRLLGIRTVGHRSVGWAALSLLLIPLVWVCARAAGGLGWAHPIATTIVLLALLAGTRWLPRRLPSVFGRFSGETRREALAELAAAFGERAVGARSAEEVKELLAHTIRDGTHVEGMLLCARDSYGVWRTYPEMHGPPLRDVDPAMAWLAGQDEPVTRDLIELLTEEELSRALQALADRIGAEVLVPAKYASEMVGVLATFAPHRGGRLQFDDDELVFLRALAAHAGVALTNARLYEEVQRRSQGLEAEVRGRTEDLARALEELKHAQARLVHAERMSALGLLVAGVSHEINNALNFIYGNLPTLVRYIHVLDELGRAYAERLPDHGTAVLGDLAPRASSARQALPRLTEAIGEGARSARAIVEDLRRFARRGDDAEKKPYAIEEGISAALNLLRGQLAGVEIVRCFQPGLPSIECHATQINQIWMVLLINAAQAVAGAGSIEISTSAEPAGSVTVTIKDSGPGIPAENLPHVFEPFFTTRKAAEASGLGLTVARDVAQRHGGHIEVVSEAGRGASFRVILPIRAVAAPKPAPAEVAPAPGAPS